MEKIWKTSRREISYSGRTLIIGILNVTPDSFSDGGKFSSVDNALRQAEKMISEGADILDIGGESTRPGGERISAEVEISRVIPVVEAVSRQFEIPISIDTSKSEVAERAIESGAEIINDISGLTFDDSIGGVAARKGAALILMHLRGSFSKMHSQKPVENVLLEVQSGLRESIERAKNYGVERDRICIDVGIGFSKSFEQNLELIAKLGKIKETFLGYPILLGTSRKSFIGKILGEETPSERIFGTIATNVIGGWNGANIVRVHDVKPIADALRVLDAIKNEL